MPYRARQGRLLWGLCLAVVAGLSGPARADEDVLGTWEGRYSCGQGDTALTLAIRPATQSGDVDALFHFHATPGNPRVPEGCFAMEGTFDGTTREMSLSATRWLRQPPNYVTVDLVGQLAPEGDRLSGTVLGPSCRGFDLRRVSGTPGTANACRSSGSIASGWTAPQMAAEAGHSGTPGTVVMTLRFAPLE